MIVTVRKRFSQGLAFDANYTVSKSLDESTMFTQNNVSQYQSSFFPGFDYGPSLFDLRHLFNANGSYDLPFGKNRFLDPGNAVLNKIVGGWSVSGIFLSHTGFPLSVFQSAQAWGGGAIFGPTAGAIQTRGIVNGTGVFSNVSGSNGIGVNADPARRGTGLNLFSNPEQALNSFRRVEISSDTRDGRGVLRGLNRWFFDLSLSKDTKITEKINFSLSFDFLNVFNHVIFNDPTVVAKTLQSSSLPGGSLQSPRLPSEGPSTGERAPKSQMGYQVQLRSALPIRQAMVRQQMIAEKYDQAPPEKKQEFDERAGKFLSADFNEMVMVHVSYNASVQVYDRDLARYWHSQTTETLKNTTFLIASNGEKIQPTRHTASTGAGREFQLIFPRQINGQPVIGPKDKSIKIEFNHPKVGDQGRRESCLNSKPTR